MTNLSPTKLLIGAIAGLLSAVLIDLHAYTQSPNPAPFNWGLALSRWGAGAVTGLLTAVGVTEGAA